jgi:hypothetical protein
MKERSPLLKQTAKACLIGLRTAIGLILVVDAVARPIYRPFVDRINQWKIMQALDALVSRLPRSLVLVLFGVPFVIAEPLKVFALLQIAEGHLIFGLLLMVFSYLVTFFLVERIYHAGKEKLLTYRWFAWGMQQVTWVLDSVMPYKVKIMRRANAMLRLFRKSAP